MTDALQRELTQVLEKMSECGYIGSRESAQIPVITRQRAGIVYGPLAEFPTAVDLIVMWLSPRQAMLYSEAAGTCRWTESAPTAVFGRPGCASLPLACERSAAALSFGCSGMRTFTEISHDRLLAVVPGTELEQFVARLERSMRSNGEMGAFYAAHKAQFA
jgi:uncharacterized protein (DUF169 family)